MTFSMVVGDLQRFGKTKVTLNYLASIPIGSMHGIFTYNWLMFMVNVGKYAIHGSYGIDITTWLVVRGFFRTPLPHA